jgi:hypothetical protein
VPTDGCISIYVQSKSQGNFSIEVGPQPVLHKYLRIHVGQSYLDRHITHHNAGSCTRFGVLSELQMVQEYCSVKYSNCNV